MFVRVVHHYLHVVVRDRYSLYFGKNDARNVIALKIPGVQSNNRVHLCAIINAYEVFDIQFTVSIFALTLNNTSYTYRFVSGNLTNVQ